MIRISLPFFYGLGHLLSPVSYLAGGMSLRDAWGPLFQAQNELKALFDTSALTPAIRASSGPAQRLLSAMQTVTSRTDFDGQISPQEAYEITNALSAFDVVLRSELINAEAYFVSRKAAYDTTALVNNAEQMFSFELGIKVPDAIPDIREAGKCLAFALSTAAGFHMFRATETVAAQYWIAVTSGAPLPKLKTLGTYAVKLEEMKAGKPHTVQTIRQVTNLHRNPLIHPEVSLSLDEAIGLFGICGSAITAMLSEIPFPVPKPPVFPFAPTATGI
jgi:hypothetical protein